MPIKIPPQYYVEGREIGSVDLRQFLPKELRDDPELKIQAVMSEGTPFTAQGTLGLDCSAAGIIQGRVANNTAADTPHTVLLLISSSAATLTAEFDIVVSKDAVHSQKDEPQENIFEQDFVDIHADLPSAPTKVSATDKQKVWQAIGENLEVPTVKQALDRAISRDELYYLLGLYATLTIWNADVLEPASQLQLITLEGASDKYHVFDRGSSLVATPKNLYARDRGLGDSLRTAQAMVREVHRRGWNVEIAGYDRMMMAAWIEGQRLKEVTGKELKIMHYTPNQRVIDYYDRHVKSVARQLGGPHVIA